MEKQAMVDTIITAARHLGVTDHPDGSERATGHSLRCTGAQGLVRLGGRQDAVQLQGRWQSEAVRRYTRDAALEAPSELASVVMALCGIARTEVPPSPPPEPEPSAPSQADWAMNARTSMYHLASGVGGRARCGWLYGSTGIRGQRPPVALFNVQAVCTRAASPPQGGGPGRGREGYGRASGAPGVTLDDAPGA